MCELERDDLDRGDLNRGVMHLEEGARITRELGDRHGSFYFAWALGNVAALRGRPIRAARLWGAAEAIREHMGIMSLTRFELAHSGYEQHLASARSSLDVAAKWSLMRERTELLFTFTDIFNDFAVEREVDGQGFTALYQNFLETQVATVTLRVRF